MRGMFYIKKKLFRTDGPQKQVNFTFIVASLQKMVYLVLIPSYTHIQVFTNMYTYIRSEKDIRKF